MRVIVSDSSCLIDLRKGDLLELFFEFVIPDVLLENELLSLSRAERSLLRKRMEVAVLEEDGVKRAEVVLAETPALSTYDAFAFVVAEEREHAILLTGDRRLRGLAEAHEIEVHGILWVVEQLAVLEKASERSMLKALLAWRGDPAVRLPGAELGRMIGRFPSRARIRKCSRSHVSASSRRSGRRCRHRRR